ncbi:MAG TPA: alpha/beta hydrolase [Aeromicrobium sp.]|nr:alpha/beta hydrolase [Aeromicrobium sp.]
MASYVLIPGAGGVAWYWHRVVPQLRERGHEAIAVDLPGDDTAAGLAEYTDVVTDAIGDRTGVILVAQSMAGFTAPLVCERVPVELLVLVAAMTPAPGERPGDWWANTGQPKAAREFAAHEGRAWTNEFDPIEVFLHDVPADVVAEGANHERDQSDAPFQEPWPLAAWPDVPTRFLLCRHDRLLPPDLQRRVARERLGITPDEMDGGHLPALAHPTELVAWLEVFRAEAGVA